MLLGFERATVIFLTPLFVVVVFFDFFTSWFRTGSTFKGFVSLIVGLGGLCGGGGWLFENCILDVSSIFCFCDFVLSF